MDFSKYPRTKAFLEKHPGMTLDQLLEWTEKELKGSVGNDKSRDYS